MGSFPGGSDDKEYACNVGDLDLIPGWEDALEKGMATHSSILAWEIPWREELSLQFSWVQFSRSVTSNSLSPQTSLSITNSQSLLKLMSIESVMPSNHLILCRPLLLLPSIFPSIRVFSNESVLRIRGPKYWSFSFNISPPNEPSELIFKMDWLDLLAVQGTLKSLLQHRSWNASVFPYA